MAMVDPSNRHNSVYALPSINHLDLDKIKRDRMEHQTFPLITGLNISTAPLTSPITTYPGPPPPYSYPSSTTSSAHGIQSCMSPPDPPRRTIDDEKESSTHRHSLPSLHEALRDKAISYATPAVPAPTSTVSKPVSNLPMSMALSFPDVPTGPSNPFSHSSSQGPGAKEEHFSHPADLPRQHHQDIQPPRSGFAPINATGPRPRGSQFYSNLRSPRLAAGHPIQSVPNIHTNLNSAYGPSSTGSPTGFNPYRSPFAFPSQSANPPVSTFPPPPEPTRFSQPPKFDDAKKPIPKGGFGQPYEQSVKRHLDGFDTQMAISDMADAAARTHEFSRIWSQRAHEIARTAYGTESMPDLQDIDEMMRQSNRVTDALTRIRDLIIVQQNALAEQRARAAKGDQLEDDFTSFHDDYKNGGGFAGGDAKKRRGKAAPPGRCHSCNRAETPEWRRGPDGARTLCNACGLHYAKLTRKLGVNKASTLTGSNLRPKNLDTRSPPL